MRKFSVTKKLSRRGTALALSASAVLGGAATLPATALASHSQLAIIQDGSILSNPYGAMQTFRQLGANTVRVVVPWGNIAPSPTATKMPKFNATDPNAYPAANWAPYDNIVRAATEYGIRVDFTVTGGAPRWADRIAPPPAPNANAAYFAWAPNAAEYGQFVRAVGTRYSGHFTPTRGTRLPRVSFWALFNEPNFGQDLGPQAINDSTVLTGPMYYRGLVNAGYSALHATGHAKDTILMGEFAAEGFEPGRYPKKTGGLPGNYGQTRPLLFLRTLYCVDSRYRDLRGNAAKAVGCPTNAAGSRRFRAANPGLFNVSAVSDHPYPQTQSPVGRGGEKVDYARFPDLGKLGATLDHLNRIYGSRKHYPIYNTEYGYITNPPHRGYVSPATAAYYINWAEYLSYRNGRVGSYMQYLLTDPPAAAGPYTQFASGLEFSNGAPKPSYDAFRLPVFMPHTSFSHRSNEELWGAARPAPYMRADGKGPQKVSIQLNGRTIKTVTTGTGGYFDTHLKFSRSGTVRLAWTYPTSDSFLPVTDLGKTVYSRSFKIKVR